MAGELWLGWARFCAVRSCMVWYGWHGWDRLRKVWNGTVWYCWNGMARFVCVRFSEAGVVCRVEERPCAARFGMAGEARFGGVRCGTAGYCGAVRGVDWFGRL